MKEKWNVRSTICMAQENSDKFGLLVSKSLECVDRRSYNSKICTRNALDQRTCFGPSGFYKSSQKFLVFALLRSNDASAFRLIDQPKADASGRITKQSFVSDRSALRPDAPPHVKRIHHCEALIDHNEAIKRGPFLGEKKSVLDIVQQIKDTICKKQLIECSTSVIVSISGGQDSIFLLFCLSFLQSKIDFTFKMLWCNHFWQTDSFYTTLHLTMCAVNFRRILITFLPLFVFDSDLLVFCNTPSLRCMGHHRLARRFARKENDNISKHSPKVFVKTATSETIARHWRHLTTERSCTFYTLDKAIYGHTLSDRVETIMFNLIRGAGNTGIQSLLWKRKFSTFFYNWFFLSFQHVYHNTHFSTSVIQYPFPCKIEDGAKQSFVPSTSFAREFTSA